MQTQHFMRHRQFISIGGLGRHIIFSDWTCVATIALVCLHQSIIASSAFFLTETIRAFQDEGHYSTWLLAYFASMIVPFVPGCASFVTTQAWANAAHRRLVAYGISLYDSRVELYAQRQLQTELEAVLSRNSFPVISGYVSFIHDFLSSSLNSVLSMLVISFLLPGELVEGYLISVAASVLLVVFVAPRVSRLSRDSQEAFSRYGSRLGQFWDNAVLGNRYSHRHWQTRIASEGSLYYRTELRVTVLQQSGGLALGLATLLPTAYLISRVVTREGVEAAVVAAIVVNLTRIFHILNSLGAWIHQWLEFGAVRANLRYVLETIQRGAGTPLHQGRAIRAPIFLNGSPISDLESTAEALLAQPSGRYTVRGENGSGKSTLLLALKKKAPADSFLLPATNADQFAWRSTAASLSTGERMMRNLGELCEAAEIRVLLLDEWDANLDPSNTALIDGLLDEISKSRLVVEVRH